jgi:hypothetical protein
VCEPRLLSPSNGDGAFTDLRYDDYELLDDLLRVVERGQTRLMLASRYCEPSGVVDPETNFGKHTLIRSTAYGDEG